MGSPGRHHHCPPNAQLQQVVIACSRCLNLCLLLLLLLLQLQGLLLLPTAGCLPLGSGLPPSEPTAPVLLAQLLTTLVHAPEAASSHQQACACAEGKHGTGRAMKNGARGSPPPSNSPAYLVRPVLPAAMLMCWPGRCARGAGAACCSWQVGDSLQSKASAIISDGAQSVQHALDASASHKAQDGACPTSRMLSGERSSRGP